jgi:hypothetical protein
MNRFQLTAEEFCRNQVMVQPWRTITCGVIAGYGWLFDIEAVGVRECFARYRFLKENFMPIYQVHTIASAPEESRQGLGCRFAGEGSAGSGGAGGGYGTCRVAGAAPEVSGCGGIEAATGTAESCAADCLSAR